MDEQNKEDAVGRNLESETKLEYGIAGPREPIPSQRNRLEPSGTGPLLFLHQSTLCGRRFRSELSLIKEPKQYIQLGQTQ